MQTLNEEDFQKALKEWKVKRRRTTAIAMAMFFFQGLDNFSIITTLLYYLKEMNLPPLWFSVILIVMTISEGFSSLFMGKSVDKFLNIRKMMIMILVFSMVGNFIYTLRYSVWLLVIGRSLCGTLRAMVPIAAGEFRRCYSEEKLDRVLCIYQYAFDIGYILGPTVALIVKINFTLYTWHVDQYNAVGLILAFFAFIILLAALFFSSDISKEYDTLMRRKPENMTKDLNYEILQLPKFVEKEYGEKDLSETNRKLWTWRDLMKFDILLVAICYSMLRFSCNLGETVRVYVAMSIFHWNLSEVGITRSICMILSQAVIVIVVYKKLYEGKNNVFFLLVQSLCISAVCNLMLVFPMLVKLSFTWQMVFYSLHSIFESLFVFFGYVTGRRLMLSLAPAHSASFIEGFRTWCSTIFKILCLINSAFVFTYGCNWLIPSVVFLLVLILAMLLRRRRFTNYKY